MALLLAVLIAFILYPGPARALDLAVRRSEQSNPASFSPISFAARCFREALWNTLWSGLLVVAFSAVLALPLAYVLARYEFRGKLLLQTAATLAAGDSAVRRRRGAAIDPRPQRHGQSCCSWTGSTSRFHSWKGLTGVVLVQTLHFFPFILLNTVVSLSNIDSSLEETAQNLGCHGLRLFRRVTLPLMLPGFIAGSLLTFIRAIDDLGTPLMLNYKNLLAPQAYLRITTIGMDDVDGYVVCVVLVVLSLASLLAARKYLSLAEYATVQRAAPITRKLQGKTLALVWLVIALSWASACCRTSASSCFRSRKSGAFRCCRRTYTLGNYDEILFRVPHFVLNTLLYTLLAAALDIVLGAAIAFLLLRSRVPGRNLLDAIATMPLAIPGVVLAVGYLRVFHGWDFPGVGAPLTSSWFILVIAYTMRRLPYTVRACYAALQQVHVSLEESAQNLGANRLRTFIKITLPMIGGGLVAGGLIAFVTSCVELASTIMLVPRIELGPISYGIYLYMQSPLGRGAGAALGVVAILLVSAGNLFDAPDLRRPRRQRV